MRQLHFVGFTSDHDGLILAGRRGAKTGNFLISIDDELVERIEEARKAKADAMPTSPALPHPPPPRSRIESALSPREMQTRLRAGRTVAQVAAEAGVDVEWVERFAAPVLAEQTAAIVRAQELTVRTSRRGQSDRSLAASIRRNLADRGILLLDEEFDTAWSAFQRGDDDWIIRFRYRSRGRDQQAEYLLDMAEGSLIPNNRVATELGFVDPVRHAPPVRELPPMRVRRSQRGRRRAKAAAKAKKAAPQRPAVPVKKAAAKRTGSAKKSAAARKAVVSKAHRPTRALSKKRAPAKTGPARKQAPTKKSAPPKKAAASRKAAATRKRPTTKRTAPAKRAVSARKPVARKKAATAKKAVTKRTTATRATTKRPAARKAAGAKKATTTKRSAQAKKPASKRAAPAKRTTPVKQLARSTPRVRMTANGARVRPLRAHRVESNGARNGSTRGVRARTAAIGSPAMQFRLDSRGGWGFPGPGA